MCRAQAGTQGAALYTLAWAAAQDPSCIFRRMNDLPESLFANPVWNALQTRHRNFAVSAGNACRYPADVAPFAAVASPTASALQDLHSLLEPEESVWLIGKSYPSVPELDFKQTLACLQMVLPEQVSPEEVGPSNSPIEIVSLSSANAAEMVELTNIAFPGFFRQRTCETGSYYGVRSDIQSGSQSEGELIAMSGERLMLDGYPEISGVCTHPAHRGKGLAARLIWKLVRDHRRAGLVSWLHVGSENRRAIDLYLRMGFRILREVTLHRVSRKS
jgi:predicted GNAT family acetyltransferase